MQSNNLSRVVITGLGIVSPLGAGSTLVFQDLILGKCGISPISPIPNIDVHVAGTINTHDQLSIFGANALKYKSKSTIYAIHSSDIAINDAKFVSTEPGRIGVAVGCGIGSLDDILESNKNLEVSYKKLSPHFVSKILLNMPAGEISIKNGFQGPNHAVSTACAAGAHAIGDAFNFIRLGYADSMIAGGTESSINSLAIAGFARMRALSPNKDPSTSSRPFDSSRNGFVMSEGSAILVLESLHSAIQRNAPIIAEIVGYGLRCECMCLYVYLFLCMHLYFTWSTCLSRYMCYL